MLPSWNGSMVASAASRGPERLLPSKSSIVPELYTRVAPADVPHMSFRGYCALLNLEPETQQLIALAEEYPNRSYSASWKLFADLTLDKKGQLVSEQQVHLALFCKNHLELGTREYLVRAARDIKKGTPVCLVGGQLMELWKAEPHAVSEGGYEMRASELDDLFAYPRSHHSLVLLTHKHHNIAKYIRDPTFRTEGEGASLSTDLIVHKKKRCFVLLLFATRDIQAGEEVFAHRFLGDTRKQDHQNMVLAARVSHWHHRWATKLEQAALAAKLGGQLGALHAAARAAAKKKGQRKLLTPVEQRTHMRGVDSKQKGVPSPPPALTAAEQQALFQLQQRELAQQRAAVRDGALSKLFHYFRRQMDEKLQAEGGEQFLDYRSKQKHISARWNALSDKERERLHEEMLQARLSAADSEYSPADHDAIAAITAQAREDGMEDVAPADAADGAAEPSASPAAGMAELSIAQQQAEEDDSEERKEGPASEPAAASAAAAAAAAAAGDSASASSSAALKAVISELGGPLRGQIETDLLKLVSVDDAMERTGCTLIPRSVIGESVKEETRLLMLKLPRHIPTKISIDGEAIEFNRARLDFLLASDDGYDPALLEVREIQSLRNPCRYFVPPWYRTYTVTAKANIKRGDLLCIYAGELEEKVQHRCSSYVYELPSSLGASHFESKDYQSMPDLLVDAQKKGGVGRFFNDNTFRGGEYQSEQAVNVGVTWVYDLTPHLIFYATKDVRAGDELVSSYGDGFWDVMCRQALRGHSAYFSYIRPYASGLVKLLKSRGIPLPERPDYVIEHDPLFTSKHAAYDPPAEDSSDDEDDDGDDEAMDNSGIDYSVERVVGKMFKREGGGKRHKCYYLLKWVGYADSDNSWEPLVNLDTSMELVAEFEAKLAAAGLTVGVEPLDGPQPEEVLASAHLKDLPVDESAAAASDSKKKKRKPRKPRASPPPAQSSATAVAAAAASSSAAAAAAALAPAPSAPSGSAIDLTSSNDDEEDAAAGAASRKRRAESSAAKSSSKQRSSSSDGKRKSGKQQNESDAVAPKNKRARLPAAAVVPSASVSDSASGVSSLSGSVGSPRSIVAPAAAAAKAGITRFFTRRPTQA